MLPGAERSRLTCTFRLEVACGKASLVVVMQDESPDVRQSAFALTGDLSKVCAPLLAPAAGSIFRLAIAQLEPPAIRQESMSACNNACWSLGEELSGRGLVFHVLLSATRRAA